MTYSDIVQAVTNFKHTVRNIQNPCQVSGKEANHLSIPVSCQALNCLNRRLCLLIDLFPHGDIPRRTPKHDQLFRPIQHSKPVPTMSPHPKTSQNLHVAPCSSECQHTWIPVDCFFVSTSASGPLGLGALTLCYSAGRYRNQETGFGTAAVVGDLSFSIGFYSHGAFPQIHPFPPQTPLVSHQAHVQTPLCQYVLLISLDAAFRIPT